LRRRSALAATVALALLANLPTVRAQTPTRVAHIGFLYVGSQTGLGASRYRTFLDAMRGLGYLEGSTLMVEARFAEFQPERLPGLAEELLRLKVEVIVATGSPAYRVLQRMNTPPIIVTVSPEPVLEGLAASLARPGGRFTGIAEAAADLNPKQLELLRGVVPRLSRIGVLVNPNNVAHPAQLTRLLLASQKVGVQVVLGEAGTVQQIDPSFAALAQHHVHAAAVVTDTFFGEHLEVLGRAALKYRLPSIYLEREYTDAGGLMSYGPALIENFRRAATYVDKILKGADPAQLPFEQPTTYVLTINTRTAKALNLTIPHALLLRADGVVE
jgi:putative tryptophan/tyrosine transport system substrate-binding protein